MSSQPPSSTFDIPVPATFLQDYPFWSTIDWKKLEEGRSQVTKEERYGYASSFDGGD